ncbi:MAG TPA: peptidase, partial [Geobacteraceae bacterium]
MRLCRSLFCLVILSLMLTSCQKKQEPMFYESSRKGTAEAPVKEVPKDLLATQQAFSNVVKAVNPCVVNIS